MSIIENLAFIQKEIEKQSRAVERRAPRLVAVSKKQPIDRITAALEAGQRIFGENRVQEACERWPDLKAQHPDLQLHMIGPLQTNKVKDTVALFDLIQTVDRAKLADALKNEMEKQGRNLDCFIQVNTGAEDQKAGVLVADLPALLEHCRTIGLSITGLMCIPPQGVPVAPHFAFLRKLAGRHDLPNLSMGMSGDYKEAIAMGATHVRLGTAVFGNRETL